MKRSTGRRFGEILVEKKLITKDQLKEALKEQKRRKDREFIGQILVELGYITHEQRNWTLMEQFD